MFRKFCKALTVVIYIAVFALPAFGAMSDEDFLNLCRSGTAQQVADAIKAGANVNAKDDIGMSALMWATVINKNPAVIKILLNAGVDVNTKSNGGTTALMAAKNPEVIKTLLNAGADVNAKSNGGATALMMVVWENKNPEAIKMLLNAGADVNDKNNYGRTALMEAVMAEQNAEVIKMLLNAGADVKARDKQGMTALDYVLSRNTEVVKVLETAALIPIPQVKRSAERGDANAQYQLGMMYAKGDVVPEDQWEAVVWLKKAAKQGHRDARNELARRGIYE